MSILQLGGYRYRKRSKRDKRISKKKYGGSRRRNIGSTKRRRNIKRTKRNKQR
jgi:hypothetical protein